MGHYHPKNTITNTFFEELGINTTSEWILDRVGIHERRTDLPLDYIKQTYNSNPAQMKDHWNANTAAAIQAAGQMALQRADITANEIGLVIGGSSSPIYSVPTLASFASNALGINCPCYDVNSGCAMFNAHLDLVNKLEQSTLPDYILLVTSDHLTRSVNFADRSTAVLFGDCTTVAVLSKKIRSNMEITYTFLDSSPQGWDLITIPTGGHISMSGREVQKFAIKKTMESLEKAAQASSYRPSDHYFIGHQANLSMLQYVCKKLSIDTSKHLYNVDLFGNCGGASAPSVLSQNWDKFISGDEIGIAVVGTGLAWGASHIRVT